MHILNFLFGIFILTTGTTLAAIWRLHKTSDTAISY